MSVNICYNELAKTHTVSMGREEAQLEQQVSGHLSIQALPHLVVTL